MKAIWNNKVIAESNDTEVVEGNHYFPHHSLRKDFCKPSSTTTVCPWKGTAQYYSLDVEGVVNKDAVWFYPEPHAAAIKIKNRVAFWKGVKVTE